jgi:lipopolysaccharide export system protein LptC
MVNAKNIGITALIIIAISLSSWSILLSKTLHRVTALPSPYEVDSFMQDVVAIIFNQEGNPTLSLITPKMLHFAANNTTKITTPHVTIFRESPKPWYIDSDLAIANEGINEILFVNNVSIHHPADSDNPNTSMQTDSLTVFPKTKTAQTDKPVLFMQPETTIHAIGMLANLATGTIKLLSQAKGEYAPTH